MLGVDIWILLVRAKCQKWRNFTRKFGVILVGLYVDLVLRGRVLDACLTRSIRTCSGARVFALTPALISSQLLDLLRLTLVTDHGYGLGSTMSSDLPATANCLLSYDHIV
jgi:hypothetical protein